MNTIIRRLPPHLIRHIAAGEVIDRPYSVVKELLENALDAQADRISIELEQGGLEKIKIIDNGQGITAADLPLVFERYATSKIKELGDLLNLFSFGFRGEALYAIASVAEVTVQAKTAKQKVGSEAKSIRGQLQSAQPIGHQTGTTVLVEHLFQAMPVRRKQLKPRQELQDILRLIQGYSMEFPAVGFQLFHNGKSVWSSFRHEEYSDRIHSIWKSPGQGLYIQTSHSYVQLAGWMSAPEQFVTHRRHMYCFINHRLVDPKIVYPSIVAGLKTFFHRNLFPQFHLSLQIPPEFVDVNLHPQKKTVTFLHAKEIGQIIQNTIEQAVHASQTSTLRYEGKDLFIETGVKETQELHITGQITQLHDIYLLVPTNQGFLLIDQHAADERLWYNRLLKEKKLRNKIEGQLKNQALQELADDEYVHSFEPKIDAKVAIMACHSAIRAGQILQSKQMQELVNELLQSGAEALVCPHGRPTYVSVSLGQLARMFRR